MTVRRGYADTPVGQLHYAEAGTGPAVLLLHQTPRSHDEFRELQPLLADRSIAMDMLGFGLSAVLGKPQTIEQYAAGAFALLDALSIDEAALLGHHTGAAVALEMAAAHPERVRALVLSSPPWTKHAHSVSVDVVETDAAGTHLVDLWSMRRPYYPDSPQLLERFVRDALAVDPAEGHRACRRYRIEDRIGLVTAPVLLIGATADPFALPNIPVLQERLTAARSVDTVLVDGGMIPLMEAHAQEVADVVGDFLKQH
ncbi:alpha/beta fold hydrolase [Kribbella sp. NPDC050124]|uniref:alpha/beta fold hydrolase n=1 Tax=Kribbella sp. NPDC050124 TaxID=3364114 RepID=UPI00378DA79C